MPRFDGDFLFCWTAITVLLFRSPFEVPASFQLFLLRLSSAAKGDSPRSAGFFPAEALYNIACCQARTQDRAKALESLEKALAAGSRFSWARMRMNEANSLMDLGHFQEATLILTELRPAVALFLRFGGLDYDTDPAAPERLDAYLRWVQQVIVRYEGVLLQLTVGVVHIDGAVALIGRASEDFIHRGVFDVELIVDGLDVERMVVARQSGVGEVARQVC